MTVQIRNAEMVDLLKADFQHLANSAFAWESACSAFMALPMLRGLWTMASVDATPQVWDTSGNLRTLTYNGNPTFNAYDLAPYIDLDGAGDFLSRVDAPGFDIIGNETYVATSAAQGQFGKGLTLGGWFWRDVEQAQGLIGKAVGGAVAYSLTNSAVANQIRFDIFDAGNVQRTVNGVSAGLLQWEFLVGRFEPTFDIISVFVNGTEVQAAIPGATTIRNTADSFTIGNAAGNMLNGRASLGFLCAGALSDVTLFALYEKTRRMFYV
jgi:hypothetical protein